MPNCVRDHAIAVICPLIDDIQLHFQWNLGRHGVSSKIVRQ